MVSGDVKAQQKLSARSVRKVQTVIEISKKRHSELQEEEKLTKPFVDITISKANRRRRR